MPENVPPHESVNHVQSAPVPNIPPGTINAEPDPLIIVSGIAVILPGNTVFVFTVIFSFTHGVVLHIPSALT